MRTFIRFFAAATLFGSVAATTATAQIPINDKRGEAWSVVRLWDQVTPEAGIAWPANSGLNWQQKYSAWVQSMRKIPRWAGEGGFTFEMSTPYGKILPAPTADCADTSMIVRLTFASWYGLPMLFRAGNYAFGHFGVWAYNKAANAWGPTNSVCANCDYTGNAWDAVRKNWKPFGTYAWPTHAGLRSKSVGSGDDQPQVGGGKSGAYFDALFLNKRAGYVIAALLSGAGSGNLAGEQNVYNIRAEALQAGDLTIERWQQEGIGHTIVIKEVIPTPTGKKRVGIVAGWLPPRQSLWEDSVQAHGALTNDYMGSSDCAETGANGACTKTYANYGGGAKRWRAPKNVGGRWVASVMDADLVKVGSLTTYINGTDYATLGARTGIFETLVDLPKPEELRDELVRLIGEKRQKISDKPNTCSGREGREDLFEQLYSVMSENFGMSRVEVDQKYRATADYVFAPLQYTTSGTCCWNGNGSPDNNARLAAMGKGIVDLAVSKAKSAALACAAMPVFKKTNGDYAPYSAALKAAGVKWLDYTNDENCAQGKPGNPGFANDQLKPWTVTPYCTAKPYAHE